MNLDSPPLAFNSYKRRLKSQWFLFASLKMITTTRCLFKQTRAAFIENKHNVRLISPSSDLCAVGSNYKTSCTHWSCRSIQKTRKNFHFSPSSPGWSPSWRGAQVFCCVYFPEVVLSPSLALSWFWLDPIRIRVARHFNGFFLVQQLRLKAVTLGDSGCHFSRLSPSSGGPHHSSPLNMRALQAGGSTTDAHSSPKLTSSCS